jgi:hypothetical protein
MARAFTLTPGIVTITCDSIRPERENGLKLSYNWIFTGQVFQISAQ